MFYNLGGPNATYFEDRVNVLIALCPFYVMKYVSLFNRIHSAAHSFFISLGLMNPYTRFYQANGVHFLSWITFDVGCTYKPLKYWCDFGVGNMATSTHEYTNDERSKVFFGHYPRGSSIRAW